MDPGPGSLDEPQVDVTFGGIRSSSQAPWD